MKRHRSIAQRAKHAAVAAAALVAFSAVAAPASAFCRSTTCRSTGGKECKTDADECPIEGAKLWWPTTCISYAVNAQGTQDLDPEDSRDIIRKSFMAWNQVTCSDGTTSSLSFEERDPVSCRKSEYNKDGSNLNVIFFQDYDWKYRGIDGTLAKTSVTYNDDTGEIYDADIEVNTANNTVTITDKMPGVEYDLQSILTHEVGHFVGIAHTQELGAIMFASYSSGSLNRKLAEDDVNAVCAIYPEDSKYACRTEPRGGFSGSCPDKEEPGICSTAGVGLGASDASAGVSLGVFAPFLLIAARASRSYRGARSKPRTRRS